MRIARFILLAAVVAAAAVPAAWSSTPLPSHPLGHGNEQTAGGGLDAGLPFVARSADAVLDVSFDQLEIYLFPKPVACSAIAFSTRPYVQVTVDTAGAPLLIGKPSLQNGRAFVQANFYPRTGNTYYAIQPGVALTLTRVDPTRNGVWHGRLTVKRQQLEGRFFSYDGTFAARWCGND